MRDMRLWFSGLPPTHSRRVDDDYDDDDDDDDDLLCNVYTLHMNHGP